MFRKGEQLYTYRQSYNNKIKGDMDIEYHTLIQAKFNQGITNPLY